MSSSRCARFVCLIGLVFIMGCGSSGPTKVIPDKSAPVTGIVTMDGKPLVGAKVTFYPTDASQGDPASGATDSSGKYELQALFGKKTVVGAAPGGYKVTISQMVRPDGTPLPPDSKEPPMNTGAREAVPLKYSGFGSTELSATVSSSGSTFDFQLKSSGGQP